MNKQLLAYYDEKRVRETQDALKQSRCDSESFRIVKEFGSNSFRTLLDKAGISTYEEFLNYDVNKLYCFSGVGVMKVGEFELAQKNFNCGSLSKEVPLKSDNMSRVVARESIFEKIPRVNEKVPELMFLINLRSGRGYEPNVFKFLETSCPNLLVGQIAAVTEEQIQNVKGTKAKKIIKEFVEKCKNGSIWTLPENLQKHACDFSSLSDMIVGTVQEVMALNDQNKYVMKNRIGLLDVENVYTLEEVAKELKTTRQNIERIEKKVLNMLQLVLPTIGYSELKEYVTTFFEERNMEVLGEDIVKAVREKFNWESSPTLFSLKRVLLELGFELLDHPERGSIVWNGDGDYDWCENYEEPSLTDKRRAAIKAVLEEGGRKGLTKKEILSLCKEKYPNSDVRRGNVDSCQNKNQYLDGIGTVAICLCRGGRGCESRYALNIFFKDDETVTVLKNAGEAIRKYIEETGLGVVNVYKFWKEYNEKLSEEKRLPMTGFYMMMRDVNAGGLCYDEYPCVSYEGMDVLEHVFWWELYQYFQRCGYNRVRRTQITSFLIEKIGMEPKIAASYVYQTMGLRKGDNKMDVFYEIKQPPFQGKEPRVLLDCVKKDE